MSGFHPLSFRRLLVLCVWLLVLAGAALVVRTACQLSRDLPKRLPLMVVIPQQTPPEERRGFEEDVRAVGAEIEFVGRDRGLDLLHERLGQDIPPLDSAVLGGIEGNPLPDVYIVRAEHAGIYITLRKQAETRFPSARIHVPEASLARLSSMTAVGRAVSAALLGMLSLLFCVSWSDHVARRICADPNCPDGFLTIFRQVCSQAVFSLLICIAALGGLFTLGGAAADRRPDWPIRPVVRLGEEFLRFVDVDGAFIAVFFGGLAVLFAIVAGLARPNTSAEA